MRYTDIDTFLSIVGTNDAELIESYIRLIDNDYVFPDKPSIKKAELSGIYDLFSIIAEHLTFNQKQSFFCSVKNVSALVEQFDILRFSEKSVLNIEIKSRFPKDGLEGIKYQLLRHRHMLGLLNKAVYVYTYLADSNVLYKLNGDEIETVNDIKNLVLDIDQDSILKCELLDVELSKMIISPYSQPEDFSKNKYYLTAEQMAIKVGILKSKLNKFCVIGGPGTGKSLILFDLANEYTNEGKKVIIVFGSMMSKEEAANISDKTGVKVIHVKYAENIIDDYDVVMLDEAQRVWKNTINSFLKYPEKIVIFSLDREQTLHYQEELNDNQTYLMSKDNVESFTLKSRIRTDPIMSSFIMKFLHYRKKGLQPYVFHNVSVAYFNNKIDARKFIMNMCNNNDFTSIELTKYIVKTNYEPKREPIYSNSIFTHSAVGREYNNVLIPLDENFYHDKDGKLQSKYSDWYPYIDNKMIFQGLTRVKKKLVIVVINNSSIFKNIECILNWKNLKE